LRANLLQWFRTPGGVRNFAESFPLGGGNDVSMVPHPRRGAEQAESCLRRSRS